MTERPVIYPFPIEPEPAQSINLRGVPPDPATFEGPLNEFIELHGTAVAYNTAAKTKAEYVAPVTAIVDSAGDDILVPPAHIAARTPTPTPTIGPISAGAPVFPDMTRYVIDRSVGERVRNRRYPHKDYPLSPVMTPLMTDVMATEVRDDAIPAPGDVGPDETVPDA